MDIIHGLAVTYPARPPAPTKMESLAASPSQRTARASSSWAPMAPLSVPQPQHVPPAPTAALGRGEHPLDSSNTQTNDAHNSAAAPQSRPPTDLNALTGCELPQQQPGDGHQPLDPAIAGDSPTAAFEKLTLCNEPCDPCVETCLAHLKLLFAIQWMKEDVGFTDGLWGLWDAHAGPVGLVPRDATSEMRVVATEPSVREEMQDKNRETLSRIREKRWALFVARAVDRYEKWWRSLSAPVAAFCLSEQDMKSPDSTAYAAFPASRPDAAMIWTEDMLPPLGGLACSPEPGVGRAIC